MDRLKPCPFCGGEPRHNTWSEKNFHVVECESCGFEFDFRYTKEEMIKDWNKRPVATVNTDLPKGYAIVPLEPTEELMDIIETVVDRHESLEDIYKAMIKAANKESK